MPSKMLPLSTIVAGFIAVLISYTSSAAIIWQMAESAGASPAEIGGWLTMLGLVMGVSTLVLTLWYKVPILTAWSTPGAALLATSLAQGDLNRAVGIFIFTSALILIFGLTGWFSRIMRIIPPALSGAMLAGILLRFCLDAFSELQGHFFLTFSMLATWLAAKRVAPRYSIITALIVGILVCVFSGGLSMPEHTVSIIMPSYTAPTFHVADLIGIGIPFFLVTMASQNAPGIATLQANGYPVAISPLIVVTALFSLFLSPFGAFSVCIAAISAAVCQGSDAHPDKDRRWMASAVAGGFYLIAGILGGSISVLLTLLPAAFIKVMAGLALLGTFSGSLYQAINHASHRDAALLTFLITASGINLWAISAPFWGLLAGGISYALIKTPKQ